jgi:deferrochelatase/peroxidase EfeB
MPVDLSGPLAWTGAAGAELEMLEQLQPNIVKAHVRDHLSILLLRVDDDDELRTFLGDVSALMKSAHVHLQEVAAHKVPPHPPGTPYVGVGLTASGYAKLDVHDDAIPPDPSFRAGARDPAIRDNLSDPPPQLWEPAYREDVHVVVLVGDASAAAAAAARLAVAAKLPASAVVLGEETGASLVNADGHGIEHFGYVDGRSQPMFLVEDVEEERLTTDGTSEWDPTTALDRVLVPDPGASDPTVHCGSYFVLRKLEQNVQAFKQGEEDLADQLGLEDDDRERAGALIIGRFEDGTPVTLQRADGVNDPVPNNFTYDNDDQGAKCPYHGHIRKTNPRGSGGFGQTLEQERAHLMARRGQTYGHRTDDPNGDIPPALRPTGGVGLLFMAFNAELAAQFEFTQATWADNPDFPQLPPTAPPGSRAPGLDPVIGQGVRDKVSNPPEWADPAITETDPVPQAVNMLGAVYCFMPSLGFLRTLA